MSKEQMEAQYQELEALERKFLAYEYEIKITQFLERADRAGRKVDLDEFYMSSAIETSRGYNLLVDAYLASNPDIKKEERARFQDFTNSIDQFTRYDYGLVTDEEGLEDKIYDELIEKGHVAIPGSIEMHYSVVKYSFENGKYYRTEYNAAVGNNHYKEGSEIYFESEKGDNGKTRQQYSVVRYEILDPSLLKEAIAFDLKKKAPPRTEAQLKARQFPESLYSGKSIDRDSHLVASQKLNNCATRSYREMLRDHAPTSHFRDFYDFSTNISYEEMLSSIRGRRKKLAKEIGKKYSNLSLDKPMDLRKRLKANILYSMGLPKDTPFDEKSLDKSIEASIPGLEQISTSLQALAIDVMAKDLISAGGIALNSDGKVEINNEKKLTSLYGIHPVDNLSKKAYLENNAAALTQKLMQLSLISGNEVDITKKSILSIFNLSFEKTNLEINRHNTNKITEEFKEFIEDNEEEINLGRLSKLLSENLEKISDRMAKNIKEQDLKPTQNISTQADFEYDEPQKASYTNIDVVARGLAENLERNFLADDVEYSPSEDLQKNMTLILSNISTRQPFNIGDEDALYTLLEAFNEHLQQESEAREEFNIDEYIKSSVEEISEQVSNNYQLIIANTISGGLVNIAREQNFYLGDEETCEEISRDILLKTLKGSAIAINEANLEKLANNFNEYLEVNKDSIKEAPSFDKYLEDNMEKIVEQLSKDFPRKEANKGLTRQDSAIEIESDLLEKAKEIGADIRGSLAEDREQKRQVVKQLQSKTQKTPPNKERSDPESLRKGRFRPGGHVPL